MKTCHRHWLADWVSTISVRWLWHTLVCPVSRIIIWTYAFDHDFSVVTTNARDFIKLLNVDVHPGLIVLRQSGLSRDEQWANLLPVIEHIKVSGDDNFLLNKLIEISSLGHWDIREIPKT